MELQFIVHKGSKNNHSETQQRDRKSVKITTFRSTNEVAVNTQLFLCFRDREYRIAYTVYSLSQVNVLKFSFPLFQLIFQCMTESFFLEFGTFQKLLTLTAYFIYYLLFILLGTLAQD